MAAPKQDPFALWRDQQRQEQPLPEPQQQVQLSPEREAIRALKVDELLGARDTGDQETFDRVAYELVDLSRKLHLEQLAQDALNPSDARARGTVLHVAAAILNDLRPTNEAPDIDTLADTAIAVLNATARRLEAA